ncbi:MAG: hypothetical protein A3K19_16250 [Lentisphaerae bacterium RIFOXYB12_FULL_65_16]|nr:MAG: hypothetical protein A3K18_11740 [Lentisphaerae bacterium RIFOXYA12_64_32]OGV90177.1 MAG: hypothetical protein A3K19_16250 [Lentisphaerae bacterium RIFOXYB12_FULL_65_16]
MDDDANILRFPGACVVHRHRPGPVDDVWDDDDGFEDWEGYAALVEAEDYPALVAYCEADVRRHPRDVYAQARLGGAYVLNGQYQTAIDFLGPCHQGCPESGDIQFAILDALFALGRTENDFAWVAKPVVVRLDRAILDRCWEYLRRRPRGAYVVADLKALFIMDGYIKFTCAELHQALVADSRFKVDAADDPHGAEVRVVRGSRVRRVRPGAP